MVFSDNTMDQVQRIMRRNPVILAAYLHGSMRQGTEREDSDVDIAVLAEPGQHLSLHSRLTCAAELESLFHRPVDIGELSTRNLVYAKEVAVSGQQIFTTNPLESDRFMATCLSMYTDLQSQRKEVLRAYSA
jgi:predicted nucleotidyltransferase